jgi:hypothetical protein
MCFIKISTQVCPWALLFLVQKQPLATLEKKEKVKLQKEGKKQLRLGSGTPARALVCVRTSLFPPRAGGDFRMLPACRRRRRPRVAWSSTLTVKVEDRLLSTSAKVGCQNEPTS